MPKWPWNSKNQGLKSLASTISNIVLMVSKTFSGKIYKLIKYSKTSLIKKIPTNHNNYNLHRVVMKCKDIIKTCLLLKKQTIKIK